jgi:mono/diheme cytochrome c family protein
MVLALALTLVVAAPTSTRLLYEQKCLYCHSEEVTERRQRTESEWRALVEEMRQKAPLLVTRSDAAVLSRYLARVLGTAPPPPRSPTAPALAVKPPPLMVPTPPPPVSAQPAPPAPMPVPAPEPEAVASLEPWPGVASASAEELERARATEQAGFALMERRCSRCHTLGRVYGKLDTRSRALAIIERMRFKTGSGITDRELRQLQDFVRNQFAE